MKKVLYPGSFDPITYGHMDVVEQALNIYDRVIIAVLKNESKSRGWFTLEERKELIKAIYKDNPKVEVITSDANTAVVDVALSNGCTTLVKGLRDVTDFEYERKMAALNLMLSDNKVNTITLFANPEHTTISSSNVKAIYNIGKKITSFVHPIIEKAINEKYSK
ncbi:MAG: pantetheine-phosphate adenylyltransferase [Clostridiales bacterium]|nr:pantetheine-phosphate adenylyltransferase [Clostridiales bacterium]